LPLKIKPVVDTAIPASLAIIDVLTLFFMNSKFHPQAICLTAST